MHIRLLMISFFLQFFPEIIRKGHVYILQTPLFRIRNKKETLYCYDDNERQRAMHKLGKNAEITRFKGLGEISPDEFKHFIGEHMRLEPVKIRDHELDAEGNAIPSEHRSIKEMLTFYMGKNTPDRQTFIVDVPSGLTQSGSKTEAASAPWELPLAHRRRFFLGFEPGTYALACLPVRTP